MSEARLQAFSLHILSILVGLVMIGCASPESDAEAPPGSPVYVSAADPLQAFYEAGAAACTDVTVERCREIVLDAAKIVARDDLPCAERSTTCEDTAACLDMLAARPAVEDSEMPTTMPAL